MVTSQTIPYTYWYFQINGSEVSIPKLKLSYITKTQLTMSFRNQFPIGTLSLLLLLQPLYLNIYMGIMNCDF